MIKMLTELELIVMRVVWDLDECTAAEVHEKLESYALTTISTVLRILQEKNFVFASKEGRRHIYSPAVQRATYEKRSLKHLLTNVFGGNRQQLVRTLFEGVSAKELARLERLVK